MRVSSLEKRALEASVAYADACQKITRYRRLYVELVGSCERATDAGSRLSLCIDAHVAGEDDLCQHCAGYPSLEREQAMRQKMAALARLRAIGRMVAQSAAESEEQ